MQEEVRRLREEVVELNTSIKYVQLLSTSPISCYINPGPTLKGLFFLQLVSGAAAADRGTCEAASF